MTYLLDTHILLWAAFQPFKLGSDAKRIVNDADCECLFSAASIWEVAIKTAKHPQAFTVNPERLREGLLALDFVELPVRAAHGARTASLPLLHRDPFDRLLLAQAIVEGCLLATVDRQLLRYEAPTYYVG